MSDVGEPRRVEQGDATIDGLGASVGDDAPAAPLGLRVAVGAASVVALAGSVAPLGLAWLGLALFGLAEVLQHTGGLDETTLGVAFGLGWVVNAGALLWSLMRTLRRRIAGVDLSPDVPLVGLAAAYLMVGGPLVLLDLSGVDVPDGLTAVFLVGLLELALFVAPLLLGAIALRLCWRAVAGAVSIRAAWRALAQASLAALGGLGVTALLVGSVAEGYVELDSIETGAPAPTLHSILSDAATDLVGDRDRQRAQATAGRAVVVSHAPAPREVLRLTAPGEEPATQRRPTSDRELLANPQAHEPPNPFVTCLQTLAQANQPSTLDKAIKRLVRHDVPLETARDLAYSTLLSVCEHHARYAKWDLTQYYWRAIANAEKKQNKLSCRVVFDDHLDTRCTYVGIGAEDARRVRAAMESLAESDQMLLTLFYVEGHSHREIATLLEISEAASRKRVQRPTEALRKAYADRAY